MSQENLDAWLAAVEAMNEGDVDRALDVCAEDCVLLPLRSGVQGGYRGHDGIREWLADNAATFDVFRATFSDVRDLGDRVLAIGAVHIRGVGGGVEMDSPAAGIATFREGKMTRWQDFGDRSVALEAAGLDE